MLCQLAIHHAIQTLCFIGVAGHGIVNLFRCIDAKVMRLSEHGTESAHLKHQPLQHGEFFAVGSTEKAIHFAG